MTSLTQPGQEPHDLEISARQTAQLQESDAVLYLKNLQPSSTRRWPSPRSGQDRRRLADHPETHGNEVGGHAAAHDSHEGEEPGGKDPHIWLDPVRYAAVAKVSAGLREADPKHADAYRANTDALVKKLDDLDARFASGLRNTEGKVFVTTHAAFGYLAERYGLTEEAINGLDPESEPSAARGPGPRDDGEGRRVTTVFYETLVSDKTARTIAQDANLRTDVLDPIEGITSKSRGKDYFAVQEANLGALQTALGAK